MAFILSITNPAGERLPEVVYKDLDKKNEYMEEHRKESIKKYNEEMPTFSKLKSYYQFRWTHLFITVLCGVIGSLLLVLDRKHWGKFLFIAAVLFLAYQYKSLPNLLPTQNNLYI